MQTIISPIFITLRTALTATVLVSVIATFLSWKLSGRKDPFALIADYAVNIPLFLPPTVVGYALVMLLGRSSFFGNIFSSITGHTIVFTPAAAILAAATAAFPLFYRSMKAHFESIDKSIHEAASIDGTTLLQKFFHVLLPLTAKGFAAGFILSFLRAMGEFGITMMIAGNIPGRTQTLSLAIWDSLMIGETNRAALLTAVLAGLSLILLLVFQSLTFCIQNISLKRMFRKKKSVNFKVSWVGIMSFPLTNQEKKGSEL